MTAQPVGRLRLHASVRGARTIATDQYFQGALRVLRPHYLDDTGQVTYTIVNPGGGYLGGDEYDIAIEVADTASMVLTTQSATKVYRTPDSHAHQRMTVRVGAGAVLEHLPDQLIAYRDAAYVQDTVVDLDPTASYVTAEVVTPGWAPDGTLFRYEEVRLRQEIRVDGRIAVVDNLVVRPGDGPTPVASALIMDGRTHVGTLLAVDRRIDADLIAQMRDLVTDALTVPLETLPHPTAAVTAGPEDGAPHPPARVTALAPLAAVTSVDGPGLAVRVLGTSTEQVNRALFAVVDALRERWRGQPPVHLRKY